MKILRPIPIIRALFCLAFIACVGCDKAQVAPEFEPSGNFDINVSLSTNVITVGDTLDAAIEVYHPPEGLATVPELDRRPDIVVRNRKSTSESFSEELAVTRIDYTLTSYRVGIHPLSSGMVSCAISGTNNLQRPFPEINLVVNSVLTNDQETVREIRTVRAPESPFPWMVVAIIGVVVLAIALAVVIALLVKNPTPERTPPAPPPPHQTALTDLARLKASGMIEERDFETFYVAVSSILREYIEGRYKLHAPDMTTEEFILEASKSHELNAEHHTLVKYFLEECDMVKFAKLEPDESGMLRVWDSAERFVKETIPGQNPYGPQGGQAR